ncbi:MAG: 1-phosphofructokinase [Anaerolineae bacterium]|nr:1-phosphofructokinase [Anaerolineae bacterium]
MIYTVTLNPALDRTLTVPSLRLGELNRAHTVRLDLSGKGINVSRALRMLGVPSRIIAFLGGGTGTAIRDGLATDGFETICVEVADETRQNITVVDEAAGVLTKINEPGAAVSPADLAAMAALIDRSAAAGDLWVFSGSLPPGAPSDFYARLITLVQARGGRAFLDSSGEALRQGLAARPYAIKPNSEEAGEALGRPAVSDEDHVAAVRWFQDNGSRLVCLTRGALGMLVACDGGLLSATPPPVTAASPIGAGDATLAGLVWAVQDGCDPIETARRAVACGTAAAMQEGTGVGERATVEMLLREVRVTRLSQ